MKSCGPRYEPCSYKNLCGKFIVKNRLLLVVNNPFGLSKSRGRFVSKVGCLSFEPTPLMSMRVGEKHSACDY
jgi:hypothetical protein